MGDPRFDRFTRSGRRVAITIAGVVVVLVGIVLCPLPGPGVAIIIAGLAILATEYVWARRLLHWVRSKTRQTIDRVRHRGGRDPAREDARDHDRNTAA
jgi:uncharacterized protein (TIGR02611 family)